MKVSPALFVPLLLAGCAGDDLATPSLLPRAAERQGFAEPVATAPAAAVPDPALDAQLAAAVSRLDGVVRGFDADAGTADRAAAAAGARTVGSEGWIAAQTALAALDDWHAQAAEVATQADELTRTRLQDAGLPYPALDALRDRAEAEATRQAARIAALTARLPQP